MDHRFYRYRRSLVIAPLVLGVLGVAGGCAGGSRQTVVDRPGGQGSPAGSEEPAVAGRANAATFDVSIPDVELRDQHGKRVHFYSDLVQGKTVVVSFFFTSCKTICPSLTAMMAQVQRKLLVAGRSDIQLISISVDPVRDTPTRLKAWSENFSAKPGWVFLTGKKRHVDQVLKALRSFTPDPQDHTPMVLLGNEPRRLWKQVSGLSSADAIADAVLELAGEAVDSASEEPTPEQAPKKASVARGERRYNESAHHYFGDIELQDQNGTTHRLYTDLMRGRVLLVNSFFSTCTGVCPVMARKIRELRKAFPERVGKDFFVLSISVDPEVDTPKRLHEYAKNLHAGPGWYFLTGASENVRAALHKFGMRVEDRENHSNIFLIGNDVTDSWKKVFSLAPTDELVTLLTEVFDTPASMSAPPDGR